MKVKELCEILSPQLGVVVAYDGEAEKKRIVIAEAKSRQELMESKLTPEVAECTVESFGIFNCKYIEEGRRSTYVFKIYVGIYIDAPSYNRLKSKRDEADRGV